jgi:hypothetical protein
MKKVFSMIVCALALGMVMPQQACAQKKEKKEKKAKAAFVWEMPELSGNEVVDSYLLTCDTLNTKMREYSDNITFYEVAKIEVIGEDGEKDIKYNVVDAEGNLRSSNAAFNQNMQIILAYPAIALQMANVMTAEAAAVTAAPQLGLKAMKYAKYIKAGPKMVDEGGKEMKEIYKRARAQAKQIKALKAGNIDDVEALNAEVNAGSVDAGAASIRTISMQKKDYEEQFGKITAQDAATPMVEGDIPEETV